ncbi:MAG TPA: PTS fructose transporter subunit IIA [Burkholderiales bacterium]|jgi:PTS system ascorbate-specific IIA component
MIGFLLITHDELGAAMLATAAHVLGRTPENVRVLKVRAGDVQAEVLQKARALVAELEHDDGLMIFVDMYGATPSNVACKLLSGGGKVEAFAGVNLPMLVKAVAYRHLPFDQVVAKAQLGGTGGVVQISKDPCYAANG